MRINVLPVNLLSDIHLRAEYREILMMPYYYEKSSNSKNGILKENISKTYTLNKGHAYFFYDKVGYVDKRYYQLEEEMKVRGFKRRPLIDWQKRMLPIKSEHMNDYRISNDDIKVNVERILSRILMMHTIKNKPYFYKYHGKDMSLHEWTNLYSQFLDTD